MTEIQKEYDECLNDTFSPEHQNKALAKWALKYALPLIASTSKKTQKEMSHYLHQTIPKESPNMTEQDLKLINNSLTICSSNEDFSIWAKTYGPELVYHINLYQRAIKNIRKHLQNASDTIKYAL